MSKRFLFVICFVLVLAFSSAAWADPIDVNNPSFELGSDGNRVPGHSGLGAPWEENADGAAGFVGVDVQCPYADDAHCHRWPGPTEAGGGTDVVYAYIGQTGANAYQVLDVNNSGDPNAVIVAGRRYTLTFDAILEDPEDDGNPVKGSLFYPDDVVNNPDANHQELASETYPVQWILRDLGDCGGESDLDLDTHCPDWNYDLTVKYVALSGSLAIGKTLGVKLTGPTLAQEAYAFVDNVRLDWSYATIAYDPNPADGAELITKNPTLTWKPGVWADQHEVYFDGDETAVANADNTDTTGIYKQTQDPCSYTPAGPLVLGETYYWKITEVNSGYSGPAAGPPWEGDVWSFRVEGHAYDPSPADRETDVVFLGLDLEWAAGAEAENHVVYLGTDETAVANADTTDTTGIYKTTLTIGTESYSVAGQLIAGETYYWRIDEKSGGSSHLIAGDVWSFEAGTFLVVEDFESYANPTELYEVWDDYWVNGLDGYIYRENDVNIIRESGSQAVELEFENVSHGGSGIWGSKFDVQDMSELDIGSDWTTGGVKALFLYVRGDPCNAQVVNVAKDGWNAATPWIELEDTSSNVGYVLHPNPERMSWDSWNEWNIDLGIFDACGVTLSAIDRFTIGIGGNARTGQSKPMSDYGYIYVDDIRLYPPRCRPDVSAQTGDFTGDCNVMYDDLDIMATDWLLADGCFPTSQMDAALSSLDSVNHPVTWTTGPYDGNALVFDGNLHVDMVNPGLNGLTNMSITAWVKRNGNLEWVGIVSSREDGDATELGIPGSYGGSGGKNTLEYAWNEIAATWKHHTDLLIPDQTWTFVAMALDPNGCDFYMRPIGQALETGTRHNIVYDPGPLIQFSEVAWIGRNKPTGGKFKGEIDDARIFDRTLNASEMEFLSSDGVTGTDPCCPAYWWQLDDGAGLVAVDSGCGAIVYRTPPSPANITDPEPKNSRFVNFKDYQIMADNWMEQNYWPPLF